MKVGVDCSANISLAVMESVASSYQQGFKKNDAIYATKLAPELFFSNNVLSLVALHPSSAFSSLDFPSSRIHCHIYKMKNIVRNLSLAGCVGSTAFAAPFLAVGDNAELFVTANAVASYNDNILLAPSGSERDDVIVSFSPGVDLVFGKDSVIKGNVAASSTLTSYIDNDTLNNQLFGIDSAVSYNGGGQITLSATASYTELDQPTIDVTSNTDRAITNLGFSGEYQFSEKTSIGSGFSYSHTDYKDPIFNEQWEYGVPVNLYYELTPKVDVSAGVRYTRTDIDKGGANQYDAFYYNVGARGEFTAKLSGAFSVGYNTRKANVGPDDDGSVGANASLSYEYSEKTGLTLSLSRDFANATSGGASYENTQVTLGASTAIAVDWSLSASATYRILDYQAGAQDEYIEGSLGATYLINGHLSSSLSYTYRDKMSDFGAANEFQNSVVSISLSARY